jgi:hypothetical protein
MTELQNIAQHCCNGFTSSLSCPFNRNGLHFLQTWFNIKKIKIIFFALILKANVQHTCIDSDANAILADGSNKQIKSLEIGDSVKTLDENGNLVNTDVIMIMDISNEKSK